MAGPTTPTNRENITDKEQDVIELAEFEGGVAVFVDQKTRIRSKGNSAPERQVGGTVTPDSDPVGRFPADLVGRPG